MFLQPGFVYVSGNTDLQSISLTFPCRYGLEWLFCTKSSSVPLLFFFRCFLFWNTCSESDEPWQQLILCFKCVFSINHRKTGFKTSGNIHVHNKSTCSLLTFLDQQSTTACFHFSLSHRKWSLKAGIASVSQIQALMLCKLQDVLYCHAAFKFSVAMQQWHYYVRDRKWIHMCTHELKSVWKQKLNAGFLQYFGLCKNDNISVNFGCSFCLMLSSKC